MASSDTRSPCQDSSRVSDIGGSHISELRHQVILWPWQQQAALAHIHRVMTWVSLILLDAQLKQVR